MALTEEQIAIIVTITGDKDLASLVKKEKQLTEETKALAFAFMQMANTIDYAARESQKLISSFPSAKMNGIMRTLEDRVISKRPYKATKTKGYLTPLPGEPYGTRGPMPTTPTYGGAGYSTSNLPNLGAFFKEMGGRKYLGTPKTPEIPQVKMPAWWGTVGGINALKQTKPYSPVKQKTQESAMDRGTRYMQKLNKGFFTLQMSTLGVAFSFMGLQNSFIGLFSTLADLGSVFKAKALGGTFGGVDIAGGMGVSGGDLVEGWKNFQGITSMITTAMASIAALTLSPEVMAAVKDMFIKLSVALSDPKVVEAMQQLIIAVTDFIKVIIPIIPALADLIVKLGESGLLKYIVGIALAAGVLLPILSLFGGGLQIIMFILEVLIPILTAVGAALGVGLGAALLVVVGAIAAVLIAIDLIINIMAEWGQSGNYLLDIFNALIDTLNDVYNFIAGLINMLIGWTGITVPSNLLMGAKDWLNTGRTGTSGATYNTVTHNYNISAPYEDASRTINQTRRASNTSAY